MIKPLKTHNGIVAPIDRANIDTDAIVPKQFLKRVEKTGFGEYLFYDWRYDAENNENPSFILNQEKYRLASILLTRKNFGCGSSREHAPWALIDFGIRVIIAPSFADIFYNNCFKNGILPIKLSEEQTQTLFEHSQKDDYQINVDLEAKTLTDTEGFVNTFEIDDYRREMLLNGLDEVGMTIQHIQHIDKFENGHKIFYAL